MDLINFVVSLLLVAGAIAMLAYAIVGLRQLAHQKRLYRMRMFRLEERIARDKGLTPTEFRQQFDAELRARRARG